MASTTNPHRIDESAPSSVDQSETQSRSEPPSIFIFNVGRTKWKQSNDGPWEGETLLECFANALRSIGSKGYVVQGAMYSPEGANIFIDTEDEVWVESIDIHGQ
ncbi:hypothetical protein CPB84DRAFT_1751388 [Gymnopilus junonius]|uniref:Uncharacterized protein n=1 Tax=Gymnopilus junonius TaxID=109634 RepID=A0A9P5NFF6_GYMJU|nr:hypothetical protein CPB84DRAFT_1751388 [Gymnopilus junonius]